MISNVILSKPVNLSLTPSALFLLKIDQANLDQHKAFSLNDQSCDVPLVELEGLHHDLKSLKCSKKVASLTMIS